MSQPITSKAFRSLAAALERPPPIANMPAPSPHPFADEEMIACYGLRYFTLIEQVAFPGVRLVLNVFKAYLTKPPAVMPRAKVGWIVWIAETYPHHYLVRLPGGAILLAPYHFMMWTAVAADTPITTLADVQNEAHHHRWRMHVRQGIQQNLII